MLIVNHANAEDNWSEVLALWSQIANWVYYKPTERQLKSQIKTFLVYLWNEKDWLKQQYPQKARKVEEFINNSNYMSIVADLANTVKHRTLTKRQRSAASQTTYYGRVVVGSTASRRLHYISLGGTRHVEIMQVLRGALGELEAFRFALRAGKV